MIKYRKIGLFMIFLSFFKSLLCYNDSILKKTRKKNDKSRFRRIGTKKW